MFASVNSVFQPFFILKVRPLSLKSFINSFYVKHVIVTMSQTLANSVSPDQTAPLGHNRPFCPNTVELQWLEHLWNHENMFETGVV